MRDTGLQLTFEVGYRGPEWSEVDVIAATSLYSGMRREAGVLSWRYAFAVTAVAVAATAVLVLVVPFPDRPEQTGATGSGPAAGGSRCSSSSSPSSLWSSITASRRADSGDLGPSAARRRREDWF